MDVDENYHDPGSPVEFAAVPVINNATITAIESPALSAILWRYRRPCHVLSLCSRCEIVIKSKWRLMPAQDIDFIVNRYALLSENNCLGASDTSGVLQYFSSQGV